MPRNIPVYMEDGNIQTQVVRKVPKANTLFSGKKYRINNVLWKKYLEAQETFETLLNKVLNERVAIPEASVRDEYGDYEDD